MQPDESFKDRHPERAHLPQAGGQVLRELPALHLLVLSSTQASPLARPALYPLCLRRKDPRVWTSCSVCHEEKAGSTGSREMTGHMCDSGIQAITDDSREGRQAVFAEMTNAPFLQYRHSTSIDTPPTDRK